MKDLATVHAGHITTACKVIEKYRKALEEIQKFGRKNPGYGYSCSEIAKKALKP